jgi:hypothetical protein
VTLVPCHEDVISSVLSGIPGVCKVTVKTVADTKWRQGCQASPAFSQFVGPSKGSVLLSKSNLSASYNSSEPSHQNGGGYFLWVLGKSPGSSALIAGFPPCDLYLPVSLVQHCPPYDTVTSLYREDIPLRHTGYQLSSVWIRSSVPSRATKVLLTWQKDVCEQL